VVVLQTNHWLKYTSKLKGKNDFLQHAR